MRDKLTKFNRKAGYYRVRNSLVSLTAVFLLGLGVALPIAAKARADAAPQVNESSSLNVEDSSDSSADVSVALSLD